MPVLKHIHTLVRLQGTPNKPNEAIFICNDPYCTYKELAVSLKGKASLCSKCGLVEIVMDYGQLRLAYPRCEACADSLENKKKKKLEQTLKELGIA